MRFLDLQKKISALVVAVIAISLQPVLTAQTNDASDLTAATNTVDEFLAAIISTATAPIAQRIDTLAPVVLRTHDLDFIAQVTIRRQWREFSDSEREAFLDAFKSLSVASYAARFINLTSEQIRRAGVSAAGESQIIVATFVRRDDGSEVPIDYVLRSVDDDWLIVNVIADGVSDIALKRAEYRAILLDGSSADLVTALIEQTQELLDY